MEKKILGYLDCPTCGYPHGMRITHDKNGDPFGYCEAGCFQQMRIGGNVGRVKAFINRHPWAAGIPVTVTGQGIPVTDTDTGKPKPGTPAAVPTPSAKRKATFADALGLLGGLPK